MKVNVIQPKSEVDKVGYQLVVLISGHSIRFREFGYQLPKALIKANGEVILNRIIRRFKHASEILVVVNQDQAEVFQRELATLDQNIEISVSIIEPHNDGPSLSILRAKESLNRNLPIVVSYCDIGVEIDDLDFVSKLNDFESSCVTFTGFHPHNLRNPKFGYLRCDSDSNVLEVKEKSPFTSFPENEMTSAGIYGFKSKEVLIDAVTLQVESNKKISGEFYLSLAVQKIIENGGRVSQYQVQRFASWGTPEDLHDFNYYSNLQNLMVSYKSYSVLGDTKVFLAGGRSVRLKSMINAPKQLLLFNDRSTQLWSRSAGYISDSSTNYFVSSKEILDQLIVPSNIKLVKIQLEQETKSACSTALYSLSKIPSNVEGAISFIATDNIVSFDKNTNILSESFDILVWIAGEYPISEMNPEQYSWVLLSDSGSITEIRTKERPLDGQEWLPLIGSFTFSSLEVAKELLSKATQLHDLEREVFIEDIVKLGLELNLEVRGLIVDDFLSVGIPTEFRIFEHLNNGIYSNL